MTSAWPVIRSPGVGYPDGVTHGVALAFAVACGVLVAPPFAAFWFDAFLPPLALLALPAGAPWLPVPGRPGPEALALLPEPPPMPPGWTSTTTRPAMSTTPTIGNAISRQP